MNVKLNKCSLKKTTILLIIITIFANVFSILFIANNKKSIFSAYSNDKIKIDKNKKYLKVSIEKLLNDYQNEIYGDLQYKDKILTVKGKISNISLDETFISVVLYSDEYLYRNVICNIDSCEFKNEKKKLVKYKQNEIINITGVVKGNYYDIILDSCVIVNKES